MLVGKYQYKPALPFVVVHTLPFLVKPWFSWLRSDFQCTEGSGVVIEAGPASGLTVGDRVAFNMWSGGAAAEEAVMSAQTCMKLPARMTFEQGMFSLLFVSCLL